MNVDSFNLKYNQRSRCGDVFNMSQYSHYFSITFPVKGTGFGPQLHDRHMVVIL